MELYEITVLIGGVHAVLSLAYCLFGRPIPLSLNGFPVSAQTQAGLRLIAAIGMFWLSMMETTHDDA